MSKERNKKLIRIGGHLLKERHDSIVEYNEMSRSQGRGQNGLYSDDYDTFVRDMANHIGQYDYFGHQLPYILESSELKDAFTKEIMIKAVVEYLLNYIGSDKQIDVVNTLQGGIGDLKE
jgi:thymidylate synthase